MGHPCKQRPVAVAFDGVFLVLGIHDTETATAVLRDVVAVALVWQPGPRIAGTHGDSAGVAP